MSAFGTGLHEVPPFMKWLIENHDIYTSDLLSTKDGFYMIYKSIAAILSLKGIDTFPDREDEILKCENFFDDWFLFAVPDQEEYVYGLLKMREQEHDKEKGIPTDGDTPGVTISFIAFDCEIMKSCLEAPVAENRKQLGVEINRVVSYPKQKHHPAMKQYFIRPQADAPYLIAEKYIKRIVSFCKNGVMSVPDSYLDIYKKRAGLKKYARIPDFLDQNNRNANVLVCDHQKIYIEDTNYLTDFEKLAILASHTGNVSIHSFAAEIRFHAMFLTELAKMKLPFTGSAYGSAIRADLSIGDKEFQGPTPYYNLTGKLVRTQMEYHSNV